MRLVRLTDRLWEQLEARFPQERPGNGDPSLYDFVSTSMVEVQRQFSENWENLARTIPGRTEYRTFWGCGPYVARFAVDGQLAPDGQIELTDIRVQTSLPDDPDDD